jgi:hypothetical protein
MAFIAQHLFMTVRHLLESSDVEATVSSFGLVLISDPKGECNSIETAMFSAFLGGCEVS